MSASPVPLPYPVPSVEPWLRGTHAEVPAVGRAVLHALDLALDDLTQWTAGLTDLEVHTLPLGLPPVAFHLRHIARSVDRILSYAEGKQLTAAQLAALKSEQVAPDHAERETILFAASGASSCPPRSAARSFTWPTTPSGMWARWLPRPRCSRRCGSKPYSIRSPLNPEYDPSFPAWCGRSRRNCPVIRPRPRCARRPRFRLFPAPRPSPDCW